MPRLAGKYVVMEQLRAEGVRYIFGNPGTTESPFLHALEAYPDLTYILALQEAVALGMADGYARASGRPAVVNLHISAGLANALSLLYNAHRGGTPLIVTAGQSDTRLLQQEPVLSADLVAMAQQFTKWSTEVLHAADLPLVLRRAFKVAQEPPTGPVFLSLPWDVLDEETEAEVVPSGGLYTRTRPDPAGVVRAAALLVGAETPVLFVGDRVAQAGAQSEAVRLAELLGARVYAAGYAEVNFPTTHPLFLGTFSPFAPSSRHLLEQADVLLIVGANAFNQFLYHPEPILRPDTCVIHLDAAAWEIAKNIPVTVGLPGDPKAGLADLIAAVMARSDPAFAERAARRRAAIAAERERARQAFQQQARAVWTKRPIAVPRLMLELRAQLPPDAIVVDESISARPILQQALDFSQPGSYFSGRGGAIGWGLPAALGVKLACPNRPVVALVGDGSAMYTIQALWTSLHHRLPVTWIILNNGAYRVLKINMAHYLGEAAATSRFIGMDLCDPPLDFARLAAGFGVPARRVEDPDDLSAALREALTAPGPFLLDVVLDGSIPGLPDRR
jgi:benzoylformate decarboxylase